MKYNSVEIVEKALSVAVTSYTSCSQADLRINHITFQINMENHNGKYPSMLTRARQAVADRNICSVFFFTLPSS